MIGLGGNTSETLEVFSKVKVVLRELLYAPQFSSLYRSSPLLDTDQAPFLNAVCLGGWEATPETLLERLLLLELKFGRVRHKDRPKGPRTIDLDLICCGNCVSSTERLWLPHPGARQRRFVLEPWHELDLGAVSEVELSRVSGQAVDRIWQKW